MQREEATKTALIMPFIQILGYDVFNPEEVSRNIRRTCGKKGEKIDYALCYDGKLMILFEWKSYGASLDETQCTQLQRYFNFTEDPVGVVTDGNGYCFFSNFEEKNRMDIKPFMDFVLEEIDERLISELRKLIKGKCDAATALSAAMELKYTREFKRILAKECEEPDDAFIRFFVSKVYEKKITQTLKERFTPLVKSALNQFINDRINKRLKNAMSENLSQPIEEVQQTNPEKVSEKEEDCRIVTTEEEWQAFYLITSLLIGTIPPERVTIRDSLTYYVLFWMILIENLLCAFISTAQKRGWLI